MVDPFRASSPLRRAASTRRLAPVLVFVLVCLLMQVWFTSRGRQGIFLHLRSDRKATKRPGLVSPDPINAAAHQRPQSPRSLPPPQGRLSPPENAPKSQEPRFRLPKPPTAWSKIIWQTSRNSAAGLQQEEKEWHDSWDRLNPGYRHELLTDEHMDTYMRRVFVGSRLGDTYQSIGDPIMRSDLMRYIVLLQDGGVYSDIDVACEKPVGSWIPDEFAGEESPVGVVLGVEIDNKFGPDGRTWKGGSDLFQLVNWTLMAKPGQEFMQFLVRRTIEKILALWTKHAQERDQNPRWWKPSMQEVLETTGPTAVTAIFFEYASRLAGEAVTYKNFTKITEPKLVGDVLILPIHAFGAGHQVEWAGLKQDPSQMLIHHHFLGSWKKDHIDEPNPPQNHAPAQEKMALPRNPE